MRHSVRLVLLASLTAACSPAAVTGNFGPFSDAATDSPAVATDTPAVTADTPAATADVPAVRDDVPAAVDAGSPAVDAPIPALDSGAPPPRDAGPGPVDAGALGEPEWVSLDVRTGGSSCPPLAPCGGNELGTWDVGGGCIDLASPDQLMSCPGARVSRTAGRARGRVTFAGGFARRASQWEVEADLFIPALCAAVVGGCSTLQTLVSAAYPGSTCMAAGAGDCQCAVRMGGAIDDADRYSTSANQIISASSGKRWNYCVAGDQLRYTDVSRSGPREAGVIQLTRRAP